MELVDRNEELLQERLTQDMPFNLTITIVFLSGLASLAVLNVKKLLPGFGLPISVSSYRTLPSF